MPLFCTITGTAYYANGTLGDANIYITADQVTLNGSVLGTAAQTFYAEPVGGIITLILPRGSTARLHGTVIGFSSPVTVAIPDTPTATLEGLIPVQYSGSLPQGLGTGSSPTFAGAYNSLNKYKAADESISFSTTLQTDTDLSADVLAGRKYHFRLAVEATNGAGGIKVAMGGTATYTNLISTTRVLDYPAAAFVIAVRATAADEITSAGGPSSVFIEIEGSVEIDAGGTLALRWAQASGNPADSTVLRGSTLIVTPLA